MPIVMLALARIGVAFPLRPTRPGADMAARIAAMLAIAIKAGEHPLQKNQ
jgi:hypothetical protein